MLNDMVDRVVNDSQVSVLTKQDLFLRLSSLNYLNALVKQKDYKGMINYGMIKPNVSRLVFNLVQNERSDLYEEVIVKQAEDSVYIRCYGLQFSFHHINASALVKSYPHLNNSDAKWDGIRLQPIARSLYLLAVMNSEQDFDEVEIIGLIKQLLKADGQLQN